MPEGLQLFAGRQIPDSSKTVGTSSCQFRLIRAEREGSNSGRMGQRDQLFAIGGIPNLDCGSCRGTDLSEIAAIDCRADRIGQWANRADRLSIGQVTTLDYRIDSGGKRLAGIV